MQSQRKSAESVKKSKYDEDFEPIDATPEEVARTFFTTRPKRQEDWKYIKRSRQRKSG